MQNTTTVTLSQAEFTHLQTEVVRLVAERARLQAEIDWLKRQIFGVKSERFVPAQAVDMQQLSFDFGGGQLDTQAEQTLGQAVAAYERKKPAAEKTPHPGRVAIPEHLRREEEIIQPEEDITGMVCIGEDVTETLEYTPAEIWVKRTRRPRYARPAAQQQEGQSPIVQAPAPDTPLGRSKAGASLVSHILISKYLEHLPLDRLLQRFARSGLKIPQQTIGDWVRNGINLLHILYQAYGKWLLRANYLQMDETTIRVLEDGKGKTHLGYFWVLLEPLSRAPYFYYHPGRDHGAPLKLLKNFSGDLQCDAYTAYETVQKLRAGEIRLVNCLAHIRREFFEAKGNDEKRAGEALAIIHKMYAVEEQARNGQLNADQRLALRQEQLQPWFGLFKTWLDHNHAQVTPASPIGKAIAYTLRRWGNMQAVLTDGRIEIDNNLVENAIRPVALGRKNYLFAGSHEAAQRSAIIYTFFSACKQSDVNPETWLHDVLTRIQDTKISELHSLFPQYWKPRQA
jgi:transposase